MRSNRKISTIIALAFAGFCIAGPAAPTGGSGVVGLSAPASALQDGLIRAAGGLDAETRDDILGFYAARGFEPYWTGSDHARGAALLAAVESADGQGLPASRYDPSALREALAAGAADPDLLGEGEILAMRVYLRYGRDLTSGLLTPNQVDEEINITPRRPSPDSLMARLGSGSIEQALADLAPASPEYTALIAEKARLALEADADWGPEVPEGGTLRLGDSGLRVAALRGRLGARGYAAPARGAPEVFDAGLEKALNAFQTDAGLEADGLAGQRSLQALNAGPEARMRQVLVNLERLRWTNSDRGTRYIVANIPDYSVRVVEEGRTAFRSRTIVGAVATQTPEFSENMTYMVVNPTWHIPDSIAGRVYLPKLRADPQTLAKNGMRLYTRSGTEIDPGLVDFTQVSVGNFPFRIKQNPSAANALGEVKFMFPNQFAIYLHDTPNRSLFNNSVRALSNGCVRVENPAELAALLLEGQVDDPAASFANWVAGKSERRVNLDRPIPVHLTYRTVFVDDAGDIQYRFDVYGRDAKVFDSLAALGVTLPAAQG